MLPRTLLVPQMGVTARQHSRCDVHDDLIDHRLQQTSDSWVLAPLFTVIFFSFSLLLNYSALVMLKFMWNF